MAKRSSALYCPRMVSTCSSGNAVSMIGLELAVIGLIAAFEPTLRGISGGLFFLRR